jgi:hypothetical protein
MVVRVIALAVALMARLMTVTAPSWTALSTWKPVGANAEGRRFEA